MSRGTGIGDMRVKVEKIRNERHQSNVQKWRNKTRGEGTGKVDKLQMERGIVKGYS
jgi:hypothetical protein